VATWWLPLQVDEQPAYTWFSFVYRWQSLGQTQISDNTTAVGVGFELFQILPSAGAFDVISSELDVVGCVGMTLVYIANRGFDMISQAHVQVLKYSRSVSNAITGVQGALHEVQWLAAPGLSAIDVFMIDGHSFLLISAHSNFSKVQDSESESESKEIFIQETRSWGLYKFTGSQFDFYQDLSALPTGQTMLSNMLAPSEVKFFEWRNESYLAIGQSLCSPAASAKCECIGPDKLCSSTALSPTAAVLHWDHNTELFGEMRAVLRSRPAHDARYHHHHEQALRLHAGAARRIVFAPMPHLALLFFASHDQGLVCFEWDFEEVVGMSGVEAMVMEETETTVYAVHSLDGSLVALSILDAFDAVGNQWTTLKYVKTWSQAPMRMSRRANTTWQFIDGLAGAKGISLEQVEGCNEGHACNLVVTAGPPAGESICGPDPLYPVWEDSLTTRISTPLPCQRLTFVLEVLATSNDQLFADAPVISPTGTLSFRTAQHEFGTATFSIRLLDDGLHQGWVPYFNDETVAAVGPGGEDMRSNTAFRNLRETLNIGHNESSAHVFTITVLAVNTAPRFSIVPVRMTQVGSGITVEKKVVFAYDVSPGAANEEQAMTFAWTWKLRYIVGWNAVTAVPGRANAINEVEQLQLTNVYTYCKEQQRNLFVFATANRLEDIDKCTQACADTAGCRYIIFENSGFPCSISVTCEVVSYPGTILSGIFEYPGAFIKVPPVLTAEEGVGIMSITMTDNIKGIFEMAVSVSDDGSDSSVTNDGLGSVSTSTQSVLTLEVLALNIAPSFAIPANFTVSTAQDGSFQAQAVYPFFATNVTAGTGECLCGQVEECGDIIGTQRKPGVCQEITFSVFSVQTLEGGSRPDCLRDCVSAGAGGSESSGRLFQKFEIDAKSGNLSFTTSPHWTGTYKVVVMAMDNGDGLLGTGGAQGNENATRIAFDLIIPIVNERPSFTSGDRLVINETPLSGEKQRYAFFSNVSAGSGNSDLDVVYEVEFKIVSFLCLNPRSVENIKLRVMPCSSLFEELPVFDSQGFVSFVTHPSAHGEVRMQVSAVNEGQKPAGGFDEFPAEIIIADLNQPPECSIASEVVVLANSGPVVLQHFLLNSSVGANEEWQNLFVRVLPIRVENSLFVGSQLPTVDPSGSLLFETAPDAHGTITLTVFCIDDGGTKGGGSDTSATMETTLRVLPSPVVHCITPGILPITSQASSVLTIRGQHFGGFSSRGYVAASEVYARHVQVLVNSVPCHSTVFISDSQLFCRGVDAGQGIQDVQVRIKDPFFPDRSRDNARTMGNVSKSSTLMSPQASSPEGVLLQGIVRPLFFAGGRNFLSVGYRSIPPTQATPPPPLYNASAKEMARQACVSLLLTACRNGSLVRVDSDILQWRNSTSSISSECNHTNATHAAMPRELLAHVYQLLHPHLASPPADVELGQTLARVSVLLTYFNGSHFSFPNSLNDSTQGAFDQPSSMDLIEALQCSELIRGIKTATNQSPAAFATAFSHVNVSLDGPVRAITAWMGRVFVGGSFIQARGRGQEAPLVTNNVVEFTNVACSAPAQGIGSDSSRHMQRAHARNGFSTPLLESLGHGTDGPVHTMATYQDLIVVGGSFGQVYSPSGSPLLSGGLAAWDPRKDQWSLIGRTPLPDATVLQVVSLGDVLYVAGRFSAIGGTRVNNIAVHRGVAADAGGWRALSTGLHGGHVEAMVVLRQTEGVSASGDELVVGGTFVRAGEDTLVKNIARWDGTKWQRMADEACARECAKARGKDPFVCQERNCELDGAVTALAVNGIAVYAAGLFLRAGGRLASGLAKYYSGTWQAMPVLRGRVLSLLFLQLDDGHGDRPGYAYSNGVRRHPCLYAAGHFTPAEEEGKGERDVGIESTVMRLCLHDLHDLTPLQQPGRNASDGHDERPGCTNATTHASDSTCAKEGRTSVIEDPLSLDLPSQHSSWPFLRWEPVLRAGQWWGGGETLILAKFSDSESDT
jgi:hypothetical protein